MQPIITKNRLELLDITVYKQRKNKYTEALPIHQTTKKDHCYGPQRINYYYLNHRTLKNVSYKHLLFSSV